MKCINVKPDNLKDMAQFQITFNLSEANDLILRSQRAGEDLRAMILKTVNAWTNLQNEFWDAWESPDPEEPKA